MSEKEKERKVRAKTKVSVRKGLSVVSRGLGRFLGTETGPEADALSSLGHYAQLPPFYTPEYGNKNLKVEMC